MAGLALVFLCLTVYVPGLHSIPPVDRDEARFAQASRQMFESVAGIPGELDTDAQSDGLHSGGLIVPMVGNKPRLGKPPLIYWIQSASAALFTAGHPLRDAIWMYRVPSLLAALATVLITWRLGCSMFDPRAGLLGAALLAVAPVFAWEAHQARADQLLVACTTLAMWALWEIHRAHRVTARWPLVLWLAVAAGILTKGPITPMVVVLTALAVSLVSRRWSWLRRTRPVMGVVLTAVLVLPWVVAVAGRVGWQPYLDTILNETLGRAGAAREGHWGPPGYHILLLPLLFWPGSMLTGVAIVRACRRGLTIHPHARARSHIARLASWLGALRPARGAEFFCIAWIVPAWLVFELVTTKLPHYTMPLYPPIALLTARAVLAAALPGASTGIARYGYRIWIALGVALGVAAPLTIALLGRLPTSRDSLMLAAAVVCCLVTIALLFRAARFIRAREFLGAQVAGLLAMVVSLVLVLGFVLPRAHFAFMTPRIAQATRDADPAGTRPVAIVAYHEDSLVFATRGRIQLIDHGAVEGWLADNPAGLLWAPRDWAAQRHADPASRLSHYVPSSTVTGFNYSRGRKQAVQLYTPP
ncbi:MAG: glycosyltransferase family 39 protein [Planctomycetes bacterium]|nr:glycosyltransferase family 39 protein [Planctomycetota bacterium]